MSPVHQLFEPRFRHSAAAQLIETTAVGSVEHTHIGANPTNTHTNSARIQFCHCKMEFANTLHKCGWKGGVRGRGMGGQNLNASSGESLSIYHGCRKICNQQQRRANRPQVQIAFPHHRFLGTLINYYLKQIS